MNKHQYCVILAGGGGSHLWPITREARPKQFTALGTMTLLRAAYERSLAVVPAENIIIIALARFRDTVCEIVPEVPQENLLFEPYPRKTGPCIACATYYILRRDPDAVMAVTPCDLIISDNEKYVKNLSEALDYAAGHPVLMTLGIAPLSPDPKYGYIQIQGGRRAIVPGTPLPVKTFMEKPSQDLAKVLLKTGEFLWNSGIFVWKADVIRSEMEEYMPQITCQFDGWQGAFGSDFSQAFIEKAYSGCEKISIDYGVMEKTSRAWVWPAEFGWKDIDSMETLASIKYGSDPDGNVKAGYSDVLISEGKDNVVIGLGKEKMIVLKGLEGYVVVDTPDALLVCPKADARGITGLLSKAGKEAKL